MKNVTQLLRNADISPDVTSCPSIRVHSDALTRTFRAMVVDLQNGCDVLVIRFINAGSIRADVESVLGRAIDSNEALLAGRQAPCHIVDIELSRACAIARGLQGIRASARRTCQIYRAHGIGSQAYHMRLTAFINDALGLLESDDDSSFDEEDFEES